MNRVQACANCPYKAKQCIGSVGNPDADIVIVGEAPGSEELVRGRPFIGPSGKLLYRALEKAGISDPEQECFITNALSCRPPPPTAPAYEAIQACYDRLIAEIYSRPRKLVLTLGNSALRSILRNGTVGITKERGHVHPSSPPDFMIFPTWHPAAVLRDGNRWPTMRDDIREAIALARGAEARHPGPSEWEPLNRTDHEAKVAVEVLRKAAKVTGKLSADIETSGLDPRRNYITYLGVCYEEGKVEIFPRHLIHHLADLFDDPEIDWIWHNGKFDTSFLRELGFRARCDQDVMLLHYATNEQRGTHDLKQLSSDILGATDYDDGVRKWLKDEKKRRAKLVREAKNMSVTRVRIIREMVKKAWKNAARARKDKERVKANRCKFMYERRVKPKVGFEGPFIEESWTIGPVEDFLIYDLSDAIICDDDIEIPTFEPLEGYAQVPDEILLPYLAKDCDYTWQLYNVLKLQVDAEPGLKQLYNETLMPSSRFLQRIEDRGIFVDQEHLQKLKVELGARRETALAAVGQAVEPLWTPATYLLETGAKSAPLVFNVASTPQLNWLIYTKLGLVPPPGMKQDTSRAVLDKMKDQTPFIPLILDYRRASKMLSTYVIAVEYRLDAQGRVHATFKIHGTETGRLSSADPNMQNIPSDSNIKNIFSAPPGYVLVEVDQSQAELRTLAALSGDEALTEIYVKGLDLHHEMSVEIYGEEYLRCTDSEYKTRMRRGAKTVNFGIAYGMTALLLSSRLEISMDEAQRMIDIWFARFPRAKKFLDYCRALPAKGRYIDTVFGRRRRFPLITAESLHKIQNEAGNFPIQSVASDLTLMAGLAIDQELDNMGAWIVNIVHDSLLIQVPADAMVIYNVVTIARNAMIQTAVDYLGDAVPFDADAKVGINWGKCHEYKLELPEELRMAS